MALADYPHHGFDKLSTLLQVCQTCFFDAFEAEIHETIVSNKLFKRGEKVAIGASGGGTVCWQPDVRSAAV